jgi:hypothetical protein
MGCASASISFGSGAAVLDGVSVGTERGGEVEVAVDEDLVLTEPSSFLVRLGQPREEVRAATPGRASTFPGSICAKGIGASGFVVSVLNISTVSARTWVVASGDSPAIKAIPSTGRHSTMLGMASPLPPHDPEASEGVGPATGTSRTSSKSA